VRLAIDPVAVDRAAMVVLDRAGTLGGRGAYVCRVEHGAAPAELCVKRASTRGALQRAFRRAVTVPVELVELESR
jgi:predicted RNA-binding protein YlxR (DUF448 family)